MNKADLIDQVAERTGQTKVAVAAMVEAAMKFAHQAHGTQRRKWTDELYIEHPRRVAARVAAHPRSTPAMEAAAWLHDALEDTPVTAEEIKQRLGHTVGSYILELTNPSKGENAPPALAATTMLIQPTVTNRRFPPPTATITADIKSAVVKLSARGEIAKARAPPIQ